MRKTILSLPYLYRASFRLPRKGTPESRLARAFAPFEVPEVTSVEAPASVARWRSYGRDEASSGSVVDPGSHPDVVVHRTYEGRSYVPLGSEGPLAVERFASDMASGRPSGWNPEALPATGVGGRGVDAPPNPFRFGDVDAVFAALQARTVRGRVATAGDDADVRRGAAARAWAEGLLVVDGEVWVRSAASLEPHYVVTVEPGHVFLSVAWNEPERRSRDWRYEVPFEAARRADALACAEATASRMGLDFVDHGEEIRVLDATALCMDVVPLVAEGIARGSRDKGGLAPEAWPPAARAAHDVLVGAADGLRDVARPAGDEGREWSATVFGAYAAFRDEAFASLASDPDAEAFLRDREPLYRAWETRHAPAAGLPGVYAEEDEGLACLIP